MDNTHNAKHASSHHNLNTTSVWPYMTHSVASMWVDMWPLALGHKRISLINMHGPASLKS